MNLLYKIKKPRKHLPGDKNKIKNKSGGTGSTHRTVANNTEPINKFSQQTLVANSYKEYKQGETANNRFRPKSLPRMQGIKSLQFNKTLMIANDVPNAKNPPHSYKQPMLQYQHPSNQHPMLQYQHYMLQYEKIIRHYEQLKRQYEQHMQQYEQLIRRYQQHMQQYQALNSKNIPTLDELCLKERYTMGEIKKPSMQNSRNKQKIQTLDELCNEKGYVKIKT